MIKTCEYVKAFDNIGIIKMFQNTDLMIEKSLRSFAFDRLIFDNFNSNGLSIVLIDSKKDLTEAAFSNEIRP